MSGIATSTALLITAGVTAATSIGGAVYEGIQGGNKAPSATTTQQQQAEAANAAAQAQAEALTKRRGMASTTLTSPMGAGAAQTQKVTLG